MGEDKLVNDIVQVIKDVRADAQSLSNFIWQPAGVMVERRLAPPIHTLQYYIDYLDRIPSIVQAAIDNTAIEGGLVTDALIVATAKGQGIARTQASKNLDIESILDIYKKDTALDGVINILNAKNSPIFLPAGKYHTNIRPTFSIYGPGEMFVKTLKHRQSDSLDESKRYKKSVIHKLPVRFSGYDQVCQQYGYEWLYPRGVFIDEENALLYISTIARDGALEWAWFVAYDLKTGEELKYFSAGSGFAKTFTVVQEGQTRYLYTTDTNNTIAKFDIYPLPHNGQRLQPLQTMPAEGAFISKFGDTFCVGQSFVKYSTRTGMLTNATFYNENFEYKSTIYMNSGIAGNSTGDTPNLVKPQGFALGRNYLVMALGGIYSTSNPSEQHNVSKLSGLRVLNADGSLKVDATLNPKKMAEKLDGIYTDVSRIEYEGASVTDTGRIVSLLHISSNEFLVFEEFSDSKDALDFTDCASSSLSNFGDTVVLHRTTSSGHFKNLVTGDDLATLHDVVEMMKDLELYSVKFSSSSNGATMYESANGDALPGSCLVEITKSSYSTFFCYLKYKNFERHLRFYIESNGSVSTYEEPRAFYVERNTDTSATDDNKYCAMGFGWRAPITGSWKRGDRILNNSVTAGGWAGWVCVTAGSPGMWKGFGIIES